MILPSNGASQTAVCTIVSKNYLAFARTLMRSLAEVHPTWSQVVLLVDELHGEIEPKDESFEVLEIGDLDLPDGRRFLFRYTILELNTAVKPWLLRHLFARGFERVIYCDPDIRVYAPMHEVEKAFEEGEAVVLTPHLTEPLEDDARPTELDILRAGAYNLGFIALAKSSDTRRLIDWWCDRTRYDCVVDVAAGLFVDQKWLDLVPGFFDGVRLLRDPGYNAAYWNLPHRRIEECDDGWLCNGRPLSFFHFSGLDPNDPSNFSKHQDRYRLKDLGPAAVLAREYAREVLEAGHEQLKKLEYSFGHFYDGVKVPDAVRQAYRSSRRAQADGGRDPFALPHEYFNRPAFRGGRQRALITLAMKGLWELHPELRRQFPDIADRNREEYAACFAGFLAKSAGVPAEFVAPVAGALDRRQRARLPFRAVLAPLMGVGAKLLPHAVRISRRVTMRLSRSTKDRMWRWIRDIQAARERWNEARPLAPRRGRDAPALDPTANADSQKGVNVVGYFAHASGVGESARRFVSALDSGGIRYRRVDCSDSASRRHEALPGELFPVNVIHVNADETSRVLGHLGWRLLSGRYNVGVWHWELPRFPEAWRASFGELDEIWAPSRFVQDAVSEKAPIPVVYMPHSIALEVPEVDGRRHFGLPAEGFLFLAMYETASIQARKNPQGAVAAFRRAFEGSDHDVHLVLKVHGEERRPGEREAIRRTAAGDPRIHLVEGELTREEITALEGACDVFVSLHRAEGFGLPIAECMYLGKPVVVTNWSGSSDFANGETASAVDYRLMELEQDEPPYRRGETWAEPDLEHAALLMQRLVEDPDYRKRIASRGSERIHREFSPTAVAERVRRRLETLTRS